MKLFGQIVKTLVNTALLPVDAAKDVSMSMMGEPSLKRTASDD